MTFDEWRREVDRLLRRDYAISVEDAGLEDEYLSCGHRDGSEPSEFVGRFAEKYDLTSVAEAIVFRVSQRSTGTKSA